MEVHLSLFKQHWMQPALRSVWGMANYDLNELDYAAYPEDVQPVQLFQMLLQAFIFHE